MLLRKINAIISLLSTVLLLNHVIYVSGWMLFARPIVMSPPSVPWILAGLIAAHAFISIYIVASTHLENEGAKGKSYPKMNKNTVFQRVSGILLIVFIALHIAGATGAMQPPYIVHMIVPPLFFIIALAHAAVSTDKAFITLGIGNAGFIKAAGIVIRVICALTLAAAVIGFYYYYG